MSGQRVGELELSDAVFASEINNSVMHQALIRQLSNARQGTHDTKSRGEVRGGGKKPWRQKGTGRARQGSTRAPNWIGGGTVFGPTPRKYTKALPKKMQRLALRSALSAKVAAGSLMVVDSVAIDTPKTKTVVKMLSSLGIADRTVLFVTAEKTLGVWKSVGNIAEVKPLISGYLNIRDLLSHDTILLTQDAVAHIDTWLGADVADSGDDEPPTRRTFGRTGEPVVGASITEAPAAQPLVTPDLGAAAVAAAAAPEAPTQYVDAGVAVGLTDTPRPLDNLAEEAAGSTGTVIDSAGSTGTVEA
jgi:large subunit ribosomal protein L4